VAGIFTQAQLIQAVRDEADLNLGPAGFITDAMLATWLNQGITSVQGKLVSAAEDYFLKTSGPITLLTSQTTYQLPFDAWKGRGIDVSTDPNFVTDVNTARPFNWKQRNMYNSAMGVYSFLGSTNLRYKFIPGTPLLIKFIPPNAPGNLNCQVWYIPRAPILLATMPTPWSATLGVTVGQLVSATVAGVAQVFYTITTGTTGSVQPAFKVPGVTADNTAQFAYQGPLSIYTQTWDGFNGWEEWPILYASFRALSKQQKDTSDVRARVQELASRISEEMRNVDDDEPDFVVDSYYQDGSSGGLGGFGGGWFG
jgi:hypothetical protein